MTFFSKLSDKFKSIAKKYKRATPKQLVMTGVFTLAFAGAIAGGFATQQSSSAMPGDQTYRDCSSNSIDRNNVAGGCGALSINEFCLDYWTNVPGDLQNIYNSVGAAGICDSERFQNEGRRGVINKSGELIVDDEVVMTNVWTAGRTTLGGAQPTAINLGGTNVYHSHPSASFGSQYLDAMVLFSADGSEVQFAALEACGNPVTAGNKVKSSVQCDGIVSHEAGKNQYQFSAKQPSITGNATVVKYNYYVNDQLVDSTTSHDAKTKKITLDKTSTVRVEVQYTLPGSRNVIRTVTSELCKKVIEVEEEKFIYACNALYATTKDNMSFRFNVKASNSSNVKLISADFTLDGNITTKNVTDKNDKGEIYKDYTFNDEKSHTVSAVVNFEYTKDGETKKVQSKETCKQQVTPKKPPVCEHNPKLPPEHPDCKPPVEKCVPVGKEDENCELPSTGPAGVAALFTGVAAAGTIGHRLFASRRNRG